MTQRTVADDAAHQRVLRDRRVHVLARSSPPHFHALYAGEEAQILISDGTILAGSIPRRAANLVKEWAQLHEAELAANWERAQVPETLDEIEPLR